MSLKSTCAIGGAGTIIALALPFCAVAATTASTPLPTPTCFIDASPKSFPEGSPMTLSWRAQNATDVSISNIGPVAAEGSDIRYPSYGKAEYLLTARGESGVATCSVTVTVSVAATFPGWLWWVPLPVQNTVWYVSHPSVWFTTEETVYIEEKPWWRRVEERVFPDFYEETQYGPGESPESLVPGRRGEGEKEADEFIEEIPEPDIDTRVKLPPDVDEIHDVDEDDDEDAPETSDPHVNTHVEVNVEHVE